VSGVEIEGPNGVMKRVEARLVVGADGRSTRTAELAGIAPEVLPHNRGGYQAYFKGLTLATGTDAQFWLMDPDIAYAFPNEGGVVCLATFMAKDKIPEFKKDIEGNFLRYFDGLPDGPDVRRGERIGPIVGVLDLPNMYRVPVLPGLALVGDAALASDPVWGVGCGWAFQSASWLVDHTAAALTSGGDLNAALESYRRLHYERLYAQHKLNAGYSTGGPFDPARKLIFMTAPRDAKVRRYLGLIGAERLSQRGGGLRLLSRALWVRATLFARPKAAEKPRFISG
jgi:flavin-dependent dehydrogenase